MFDLDELWTVADAARTARVSADVIRQWIRRGHLEVAERDRRGRPKLRPLDVARAEYATRRSARRIVGPPFQPYASSAVATP